MAAGACIVKLIHLISARLLLKGLCGTLIKHTPNALLDELTGTDFIPLFLCYLSMA